MFLILQVARSRQKAKSNQNQIIEVAKRIAMAAQVKAAEAQKKTLEAAALASFLADSKSMWEPKRTIPPT